VYHAGIDRELVSHNSPAACAAFQLDAPDLRRQLPTLGHLSRALRACFDMCCDEAVNLHRGHAAGESDSVCLSRAIPLKRY
jgi:hypothetical protein